MAASLHAEVLKFSLKSTSLNRFHESGDYYSFKEGCKVYFKNSSPYGVTQYETQRLPRFSMLNFEGFFVFNILKKKNDDASKIDLEEMRRRWHTAVNSFQRYCLNLILAPKRKDFHSIKLGKTDKIYKKLSYSSLKYSHYLELMKGTVAPLPDNALVLSTGYYQYNIAQNFQHGDKLLQAMGYVVTKHTADTTLEMKLKEGVNSEKLAKILVDLVIFDLEVDALVQCVNGYAQIYRDTCTILDALQARKTTNFEIYEEIDRLKQNAKNQMPHHHDDAYQPKGKAYHPPIEPNYPSRQYPDKKREVYNDQQGTSSPFPKVDPSTLPPVSYDDPVSASLDSVQHIDPSSERDDVGLIKGSTELGYRDPPLTKGSTSYAVSGGGSALSHNEIPGVLSIERKSNQPSYNKGQFSSHDALRDKEIGTGSQYSGRDYLNTSRSRNAYARQHSVPGSSVSSSTGGYHSIPFERVTMFSDNTNSDMATTATTDVPLTQGSPLFTSTNAAAGGSTVESTRRHPKGSDDYMNIPKTSMYPLTTGVPVGEMTTVTTVSGASYVTTTSSATPVLYGNVPVDNQSGAGTTAANLGKLDVSNLRKGLAKKQETTKHIELPSGNQADKRDLNSLKSNLEKKKEVRAKVEGLNEGDYENFNPLHQEATRNQMWNPSKKAPKPTPRSKDTVPGESSVAFHEGHFAEPFSSERNFKMWQCVDCHCMNQVSCTKCTRCSKPLKKMVQDCIRHFCDRCDLLYFYRKGEVSIVCPNCRTPLVTVV